MTAECIPGGFEWKDSSKIHVGEVFCLLDHWRDRKDQGLEPLIWIQTSPLFKNTNPYVQPVRCPKALDRHDSVEEVSVLSDCDEPDEEEDSQEIHTPIDHVQYLPLVGHLQMKGPRIWKHKPCKHQLSLMVTLVSPTLLRSTQRSIQEMETHLYEGVESV